MTSTEKLVAGVVLSVLSWLAGTFFYDYMRDNRDSIQGLIELHLEQ